MSHLEISKALAIAIGWPLVDVCKGFLKDEVEVWVKERHHDSDWRVFDHRDWSVIGPVATHYKRFPVWHPLCEHWFMWSDVAVPGGARVHAETPQDAIALAVISRHKK